MKAYRVICHMGTSLDGKVVGKFLQRPQFRYFGDLYEQIHDKLNGEAWICGRVTFEKDITQGYQPDLSRYPAAPIPREDFIADPAARSFAVAIDPSGKLGWRSGQIEPEYEERRGTHIVTVLSESVSDRYLAYLRETGVSYVFGGPGKPLDLGLVLDKLHRYFSIQTFLLEGGGFVNGSFLSAGLIDELSLILVPVADGPSHSVTLFEYGDNQPQLPVDFSLLSVERVENDGLWLRYEKKIE